MKQRLPVLLLSLAALLLLGGCATEPAYRYNATLDGGGYYSGQSAYGNADTVVYGDAWASPWAGWYGPGWGWGWSGIGIGATYTFHPRRHWHHRHHWRRERRHWHGRNHGHGGHGHREHHGHRGRSHR